MCRLPPAIALNAAVSASTVLASRLPSVLHVFSLLLFSLLWFALFPILLQSIRVSGISASSPDCSSHILTGCVTHSDQGIGSFNHRTHICAFLGCSGLTRITVTPSRDCACIGHAGSAIWGSTGLPSSPAVQKVGPVSPPSIRLVDPLTDCLT